jgi:RHS repeat-associated protein
MHSDRSSTSDGSERPAGFPHRIRLAPLAFVVSLTGLLGVGAAFAFSPQWASLAGPSLVTSDTTVIFGPKQFDAKPNTAIYVEEFSEARDLEADYLLWVDNGAADGSGRVSNAEIFLNGVQVLSGGHISTDVEVVLRGLSLQDGVNTLEVRIKDSHGRHLTARVLRVRSEPRGLYDRRFQKETADPEVFSDQFSLPATAAPPHRLRVELHPGWTYMPYFTVHLNGAQVLEWVCPWCQSWGACQDSEDGLATECTVELLPENEVELRMWGQADAAVRVVFTAADTARPVITLDSPAAGLVTSASSVEVAGTVETGNPPVVLVVNGDTVAVGPAGEFSTAVHLAIEGENTIHLWAEDETGNATELTRVVIRDTEPPALVVTSPPDGLVTSDPSVVVTGTVQDLTEVQVNVNGVPLVVDGTGAFSGEVLLDEGENFLTTTATDQAGNSSSTVRHVTRTGGDPDPPVLVVTEPADGLVTTAAQVWVRGTVTGVPPVTVTVNGAGVAVEPDDSFEHEVALLVGPNPIVVIATDGNDSTTSVTRNVTREAEGDPDLPPDPSTVAPELDRTVSTTLQAATEFLYTGENPIQTGVLPGTISAVRASVIRGRVLTRTGEPLPGVTITVLNHPEFGQTLSRADGAFDLAVNGGGHLTLNYEKNGYLPVQRQLKTPWQDWAHIEDVVLMSLDPQTTVVSPATATEIQVARGSITADSDGSRQATVLFKPGTQAELVMPDGSRQPVSTLTVRATEYTVGEEGPESMPGPLPPNVAYTYAVELSVDEAMALGATGVEFDTPVPFYVENFLDFPVGLPVPVAWWDRDRAAWVPAPDGRIIAIVGVAGGLAEIDVDGDGIAEDEGSLAALGIDAAERARLAELYPVGTSLWRAQTTHFSPLDLNFPFGRPLDAIRALLDWLNNLFDRPCTSGGSIIECQNQVLGERLGLVGTGFGLNYRSDRVRGRSDGRMVDIPLSGESLPESLIRIELVVEVAGREFRQTFPAEPNQTFTFEWDGFDAFGREVQGSQPARVRVGYVYPFFYSVPPSTAQSFGLTCSGSGSTSWMQACVIPTSLNSRARQEDILWQERSTTLGTWDATTVGLGGWTLDPHHYYDPVGQVLHLGTGERRSAVNLNHAIATAVGTGLAGFAGDGGPAAAARINGATDVHSAADQSLYIADWGNHRIRRVDPSGIITTVAGSGTAGFTGDGGPATLARLRNPHGVTVAPDGSIYIADQANHAVRRVAPDGIITTVAGTGAAGFSGDGGPATEARLNTPRFVAVGADGSIHIVDLNNHRIRRVSPSGVITTIAGTGVAGFTGDGGAAVQARLRSPDGIALAPDGTIYITDQGNHRVRRIDPAGIITTVAGTGTAGFLGEGTPASEARLNRPEGIHLAPDGSLYIADTNNHRIRVISPDGVIRTVAGRGTAGFSGDGAAAPQAQLNGPHGVTVAQDGSLYVADVSNNRVRRISTVLPGFSDADIAIAAEDGGEVYRFDASGRHLTTLHALTGATVFSFAYDAAGQLLAVTDGDGNVTTVERAADGTAEAIRGPFGQQTTLAMDADGYLASATNPAGEAVQLAYAADGLLREVRDPRGNSSEYTYGEGGRLIRAEGPAGGVQTLARTESGRSREISLVTGLGRATRFHVEAMATGSQRWTITTAAGLSAVTEAAASGIMTNSLPSGITATLSEGPDPRFGIQAPLPSAMTIVTPGGRSLTALLSRRATLSNPGDPLSLTTQIDSMVVNGRVFTTVYDRSIGRFTTTTPVGRQEITEIDALGRIVSERIEGVEPVTYAYDSRGYLSQIAQGDRQWQYAYDSAGRLESRVDPLLRTVQYAYDEAGRLVRQVLPDGREVAYAYDENGNLTSIIPPSRPAHRFAHDAVDAMTGYEPPAESGAGTGVRYLYDADGALQSIERADGRPVSFDYDTAGRLSAIGTSRGPYTFLHDLATGTLASVSAPGAGSLAFEYDGLLRTRETWSGPVSGSVELSYNDDFQVALQAVNGANAITYEYDGDGLLVGVGDLAIQRSAAHGLLTGATLGGITDSWAYDGFGQPSSATSAFGPTVLFQAAYTRDGIGRIVAIDETVAGENSTWAFNYDASGRLEEVVRDASVFAAFEYDANSNRISVVAPTGVLTGTYDSQDRLLEYGGAVYAFTADGELERKILGQDTTLYHYDELSNLLGVTLPDGSEIQYLIDGQNRRIAKIVNGVLVQGFLYESEIDPVAELDGDGNVVSRFVYGTESHVPDYMVRDGVTYRLISDHQGSVRLVVNAETGDVAQRIDYDPFGVILFNSNPGFQPFGFAGGLHDEHTGLVRFGARDYDPHTGRWTAKDPIGFDGGDSNLYGYVLNDPVNLIDPTGECALVAGAAAGAIGGAAFDLIGQLFSNGGNLSCVNWGQVGGSALAGAVFGGLGCGAGAFLGKAFRGLQGSGKAVSHGRGMNNPQVRSAVERGQRAHRDFANKVKGKPGWQSEPRLTDPLTGRTVRPDAVTPSGRPIELKPNTPSGRLQGARQMEKYERATGRRGRVIYYDP